MVEYASKKLPRLKVAIKHKIKSTAPSLLLNLTLNHLPLIQRPLLFRPLNFLLRPRRKAPPHQPAIKAPPHSRNIINRQPHRLLHLHGKNGHLRTLKQYSRYVRVPRDQLFCEADQFGFEGRVVV